VVTPWRTSVARSGHDALQLQVTTTNPGVPSPSGPFMYDVNFNEAVDPASVQTGDLTLSGIRAPL
jgi:hypothetical protein